METISELTAFESLLVKFVREYPSLESTVMEAAKVYGVAEKISAALENGNQEESDSFRKTWV